MSGAFCPLKSLITAMRGGWQQPEGHQELGTWLLPWPCPALAEQCPPGQSQQQGRKGLCWLLSSWKQQEGSVLAHSSI